MVRRGTILLGLSLAFNMNIMVNVKANEFQAQIQNTSDKCLAENARLGEKSGSFCDCISKKTYTEGKDVIDAGVECNNLILGINISQMDAKRAFYVDTSFRDAHTVSCTKVVQQQSSMSEGEAISLCECTLEKWLTQNITRREAFVACRNN